ncbi:MAG TPA: hypothetical protein VFO94_15910 [Gammaproteobacteria bacterium]|nr:hypothetical protein [Gammaproteobacteria bacterium]
MRQAAAIVYAEMGTVPSALPPTARDPIVVTVADLSRPDLDALAARYGARLVDVPPGRDIPGSYWGGSEAGLIENDVFVRADTPVHSLLHELCHYVCMDAARRARLAVDAGGDDDEECGVCYLEILLADELEGFGRAQCLRDMDAWGYSFREGSAAAWLEGDAGFARDWLARRGLIDSAGRPTFALRGSSRD